MSTEESIERRYLGLVQLSGSLNSASDWGHVAAAVGRSLAGPEGQRAVRLWGNTDDGFEELARFPAGEGFPRTSNRELYLAAERSEPSRGEDGTVLIGLHSGGMSLGVLELPLGDDDAKYVGHVATLVACRVELLAAQGIGEAMLAPMPVDAASDASSVMSAFAAEAKRLLDHDRLSAYLLTDDRRAFERFAVATSPIIPGEGVIIPFEDVGLRHIVVNDRPLVSDDLGRDPRIVGREDRVIAGAGFRGLLSVPLRRHGRPIGVLNFVSRTAGFYREQDIPVAQQVADQITVFVENLYRQRRMSGLIQQQATERERARLTRDLYDAVSETVPAINAVAERLREHFSGRDEWAAAQATRITHLTRLELSDVRRAVIDMSPRALEAHSLEEVVESTLAGLRRHSGADVTWTLSGDTTKLPSAVARATYRILQEALRNIRVHAHATKVRVELATAADLRLLVEDNGIGFAPDTVAAKGGLGLRGMVERAQAGGGVISIDSAPGEGTRILFELPIVDVPAQGPTAQAVADEDSGASTLRVFVTEAHPLMRAGLASLLARDGGIRVVGEAASPSEMEGQVARLRPDIVLVDEQLSRGRPAELIQAIRAASPSSSVIVLLSSDSRRHQDLIDAGASGSIAKEGNAMELAQAVRAVAGGATVMAPAERPGASGSGPTALSAREREILGLIAAGQTNTEIGESLFLATKTVERQVATIAGKLGARNRAHAAAMAVAHRLVPLPENDRK